MENYGKLQEHKSRRIGRTERNMLNFFCNRITETMGSIARTMIGLGNGSVQVALL